MHSARARADLLCVFDHKVESLAMSAVVHAQPLRLIELDLLKYSATRKACRFNRLYFFADSWGAIIRVNPFVAFGMFLLLLKSQDIERQPVTDRLGIEWCAPQSRLRLGGDD